jgi:hypothetical protein
MHRKLRACEKDNQPARDSLVIIRTGSEEVEEVPILALYTVVCITLVGLTDLSFIPVQQSLGPVQSLRTALTMRLNSETNFKTYSMLRSILCIPPTRNRQ